ncbi:MAG: glycosyltransferase family 4 protein [Pirellulaceae bacterium]
MRVAHVITRMIIGGAQENTLYNCLDLIREYGDEVLLITGESVGPEGNLLERANATGLPVKLIPSLIRNISPRHDLRAYFEIKRALREFRPDVVHTHSAKAGLLGRRAASGLRIPAILHTVHGAPFHDYQSALPRRFFIACEQYAARHCHHLISVADAMTDLMVQANIAPREKFTTVYSGMEIEPFLHSAPLRDEVRRELGFEPHHVVIGKIARLFHLKGHEYVIEAAKRIVRQCPHARFLWVGDGLLQDRYAQQIRAANLSEYFHLVGLVPPSDIPRLISAMDVLMHTSLREGLARALPQALLSGKPTVSFDIDGAREVVIDDRTGYLIPPGDVDQLASRLVQLIEDPTLRLKLGEQGRAHARPLFSHQRMTNQLREIYEHLLRDSNVRSDKGGGAEVSTF